MMIREGRPEDAEALAAMISDFNVEEGSPGRIDARGVGELCFEQQAVYQAIVADDHGSLVGYALVMRYFDTEPCAWCSYMQDLFVVSDRRSEGIGRRLLAAVARHAVEQKHHDLFWHVRDHNRRGRLFYAAIGGKEQTPLPVTLTGDALLALASKADNVGGE